ncbi:MAG: 2-phospho-L-lactate guanylyltransferase [Gammaproteobacteria bacterium]|nr:2-phospho-L-lactate guanylyltransferase [Gammaproteobacteria bacterium]
MSVWAIVPFKGAENAKRRLSPRLSADVRSRLALAMLNDVLHALVEAKSVDGILLTSRATEAKSIAEKWNVSLYRDQAHTLVDALTDAGERVKNGLNATTSIIVPGDVPLIKGSDVDHVLHYHADVTIVPDGHKIGTNALVCTPPNAFPLIFDGRSYHPHIEAATRLGLQVRSVQSQAFAVDVDTAEDLLLVYSSVQESRTNSLLASDPELLALLDELNLTHPTRHLDNASI